MINDWRHYKGVKAMRQKTEAELEKTRLAMRSLNFQNYFLFGESLGQEVSYDPEGDIPRLIKILGMTCKKSSEVTFLLLGALRMSFSREQIQALIARAEEEETIH